MIRKNALTIKLEPWMLDPSFLQYVETLDIETTISAASRGEVAKVWIKTYDESLFDIIGDRPVTILKNLRMWYDTGEEELRITEGNYNAVNEEGNPLYNYRNFYMDRKGTYDPDPEEM